MASHFFIGTDRDFARRIPLTFFPLLFVSIIGLIGGGVYPAPALRLMAIVLFALGLFLRVWGSSLLTSAIVVDAKAHGERLIDTGPFTLIRHPLYSGAGLMMFAIVIFLPMYVSVPFLIYECVMGFRLARFEEQLLEKRFGADFEIYRRRTGLFTPTRLPLDSETWARLRHRGRLRDALISECTFVFYGFFLLATLFCGCPRVLFAGIFISSFLGAWIVKRLAAQVRLRL